ncbi:MAG TPA: 5-oxoprolinase subunit PxpB [Deltaproteobacteria bacterium]|nr:5-oxoprolinase subunit PxpB [Deltaproteobacteria bacterium]
MTTNLYERAQFRISGDRSLLAAYGTGVDQAVNDKVRRMATLITNQKLPGIDAVVPSYCNLSVHYNPLKIGFSELRDVLWSLEKKLNKADIPESRTIDIPVRYGDEFGPDIDFVAQHNGISVDEVIQIHTCSAYHIFAIGFAPGFCYLGGLSSRLHAPRLETPRVRVAAGSVGIAGAQTGVYPLASPGGWRLIGRTPLRLFAPERPQPILYQAGDTIRFRSVSSDEFNHISKLEIP